MLLTTEFLGHHISKNEIASMELLSLHNKMTTKKVILVTAVTATKWLESECFLQICQIWSKYPRHVKKNRISWSPYIKNEIVSMELLSFRNKTTKKKVILVTGATARKRSESECLLQISQIWINYA